MCVVKATSIYFFLHMHMFVFDDEVQKDSLKFSITPLSSFRLFKDYWQIIKSALTSQKECMSLHDPDMAYHQVGYEIIKHLL